MSDESLVIKTKPRRARGVRLPQESPPPMSYDEPVGPGPARSEPAAEVLSKSEQRYHESNTVPPPRTVVTCSPMTRETIVTPVEVDAKAFGGFLEALSLVVAENPDYPILGGIKISYAPGNESRLFLEASNRGIWAAASVRASGGTLEFSCVIPITRSVNIVRRLAAQYTTILIGIDDERVHLGSFALPFHGEVGHFPCKPQLEDVLVSVALPSRFLAEIPERIGPAIAEGKKDFTSMSGMFLDLDRRTVIGTNGSRMHVLEIPEMQALTETNRKGAAPATVRVPSDVYQYLSAVEPREWTGFKVGDRSIMAGHEDFGVIADRDLSSTPDWKRVYTDPPGDWRFDRAELLACINGAALVAASSEKQSITMEFVVAEGAVTVVSMGQAGATFEERTNGSTSGKLVARLIIEVRALYLLDAIEACRGGSIRIGLGREFDMIVVRGDDNCFTGVIAPMRRD